MPIRKIKFETSKLYHVTNRGLFKKKIFYEDDDYTGFLKRMDYFKAKYNVDIVCHCLMPNHFHLVIRPNKNEKKEGNNGNKFMQTIQLSHSRSFNKKWGRKGSLFEGRYKLKVIEDQEQLINTIKYIINNPVEAKLVKNPEDWPYTSFKLPKLSRSKLNRFKLTG